MLPHNYVHFRDIFKQFCTVNNNGMVKGKQRAVDRGERPNKNFRAEGESSCHLGESLSLTDKGTATAAGHLQKMQGTPIFLLPVWCFIH